MGSPLKEYDNKYLQGQEEVLDERVKHREERYEKVHNIPLERFNITNIGVGNTTESGEFIPLVSPEHEALLKHDTVDILDAEGKKIGEVPYKESYAGLSNYNNLPDYWKQQYEQEQELNRINGEDVVDPKTWSENKYLEGNVHFNPETGKYAQNVYGMQPEDMKLARQYKNFYGVTPANESILSHAITGFAQPFRFDKFGNALSYITTDKTGEEYLLDDENINRTSKWNVNEADTDWDNNKLNFLSSGFGQVVGSVVQGGIAGGVKSAIVGGSTKLLGKSILGNVLNWTTKLGTTGTGLQKSGAWLAGKALNPAVWEMGLQDSQEILRAGALAGVDDTTNIITTLGAAYFTGILENVFPETLQDDIITKLGGSAASKIDAMKALKETFSKNYRDIVDENLQGLGGDAVKRGASTTGDYTEKALERSFNEIFNSDPKLKSAINSWWNSNAGKFGSKIAIGATIEGTTEASQTLAQELSKGIANTFNDDKKYKMSENLWTDVWQSAMLGALGGGFFGVAGAGMDKAFNKKEVKGNIIDYIAKTGDKGLAHVQDVYDKLNKFYQEKSEAGDAEAKEILSNGGFTNLGKFISDIAEIKDDIVNNNLSDKQWDFEQLGDKGYQNDLMTALYNQSFGDPALRSQHNEELGKILDYRADNKYTQNRLLRKELIRNNVPVQILPFSSYETLQKRIAERRKEIDTESGYSERVEQDKRAKESDIDETIEGLVLGLDKTSDDKYQEFIDSFEEFHKDRGFDDYSSETLEKLLSIPQDDIGYIPSLAGDKPIVEINAILDERKLKPVELIESGNGKVYYSSITGKEYKEDLSDFNLETIVKEKPSFGNISRMLDDYVRITNTLPAEKVAELRLSKPFLHHAEQLSTLFSDIQNSIDTVQSNLKDIDTVGAPQTKESIDLLRIRLNYMRGYVSALNKYRQSFSTNYITDEQNELVKSKLFDGVSILHSYEVQLSKALDDFVNKFKVQLNRFVISEINQLRFTYRNIDQLNIDNKDVIKSLIADISIRFEDVSPSTEITKEIVDEFFNNFSTLRELLANVNLDNAITNERYKYFNYTTSPTSSVPDDIKALNNLYKYKYSNYRESIIKITDKVNRDYAAGNVRVPSVKQLEVVFDLYWRVKRQKGGFDNGDYGDTLNAIKLIGYAGAGKTYVIELLDSLLGDTVQRFVSSPNKTLTNNLGLAVKTGTKIDADDILGTLDSVADNDIPAIIYVDEVSLFTGSQIVDILKKLYDINSKRSGNNQSLIKVIFIGDYAQIKNYDSYNFSGIDLFMDTSLELTDNFRFGNTNSIALHNYYLTLVKLFRVYKILQEFSELDDMEFQLTEIISMLGELYKYLAQYKLISPQRLENFGNEIKKLSNHKSPVVRGSNVKPIVKLVSLTELKQVLSGDYLYPNEYFGVSMDYNPNSVLGNEFIQNQTGTEDDVRAKIDELLSKGVAANDIVVVTDKFESTEGINGVKVYSPKEVQGLQFKHVIISIDKDISGTDYPNYMLTATSRAMQSTHIFNQNPVGKRYKYAIVEQVGTRVELDGTEVTRRYDQYQSIFSNPAEAPPVEPDSKPKDSEFEEEVKEETKESAEKEEEPKSKEDRFELICKRLNDTNQFSIVPYSALNQNQGKNRWNSPNYHLKPFITKLVNSPTLRLVMSTYPGSDVEYIMLYDGEELLGNIDYKDGKGNEVEKYNKRVDALKTLVTEGLGNKEIKLNSKKEFKPLTFDLRGKFIVSDEVSENLSDEQKLKIEDAKYRFRQGVGEGEDSGITFAKLRRSLSDKGYFVEKLIKGRDKALDDEWQKYMSDSDKSKFKERSDGAIIVRIRKRDNTTNPVYIFYTDTPPLGLHLGQIIGVLKHYSRGLHVDILRFREYRLPRYLHRIYDDIFNANRSLLNEFFGNAKKDVLVTLDHFLNEHPIRDIVSEHRNFVFGELVPILENFTDERRVELLNIINTKQAVKVDKDGNQIKKDGKPEKVKFYPYGIIPDTVKTTDDLLLWGLKRTIESTTNDLVLRPEQTDTSEIVSLPEQTDTSKIEDSTIEESTIEDVKRETKGDELLGEFVLDLTFKGNKELRNKLLNAKTIEDFVKVLNAEGNLSDYAKNLLAYDFSYTLAVLTSAMTEYIIQDAASNKGETMPLAKKLRWNIKGHSKYSSTLPSYGMYSLGGISGIEKSLTNSKSDKKIKERIELKKQSGNLPVDEKVSEDYMIIVPITDSALDKTSFFLSVEDKLEVKVKRSKLRDEVGDQVPMNEPCANQTEVETSIEEVPFEQIVENVKKAMNITPIGKYGRFSKK